MTLASTIEALRSSIARLDYADRGELLKTGWPEIDTDLGGGLQAAASHEWIGLMPHRPGRAARRTWSPPICVLVHLAWRALEAGSSPRWTVWVGRRCFPFPSILVRGGGTDHRLLERSLFVDAGGAADRLWAVDLALRSPSVGVVVADASGFSMAETRRVQLLAKHRQSMALTVRPPWERGEFSAAQSRWTIGRQPQAPAAGKVFCKPRWSVQLLRCKGVRSQEPHAKWALEWDSDTGALNLSTEVVHQARSPKERQTDRRPRPTPVPA